MSESAGNIEKLSREELIDYILRRFPKEIDQCAREEIAVFVLDRLDGSDLDATIEWLLAWADKRARYVIDFLAEPLREIATVTPDIESARFVARQALKRVGMSEGTS